jgi:hypothetical protein
LIRLLEPGLTPAPRPVEASDVAVVPEAQASHGEIQVSGKARQREEADTPPVKGEDLDQHARDGADRRECGESNRASLPSAHAPSLE